MKKFTHFIIALSILLTGYCPSFLSTAHADRGGETGMKMERHEPELSRSEHQLDCCEEGMTKAEKAVGFLVNHSAETKGLMAIVPFTVSTSTDSHYSVLTPYAFADPPHLRLTGSTILRE